MDVSCLPKYTSRQFAFMENGVLSPFSRCAKNFFLFFKRLHRLTKLGPWQDVVHYLLKILS
jgi:hypothetical protein